MNPDVWGPPCWIFLHTVSLNYPIKPTNLDKQQHYIFFNSLKTILPCQICRDHYKEFIENHPIKPYLDTQDTLVNWVNDLHNHVNETNGKKQLSTKEINKYYHFLYDNNMKYNCQFTEEQYKKDSDLKFNNKSNIFLIILFIIIFCFYIFKF